MPIFSLVDEMSIEVLELPTLTLNSLRYGKIETVGELRRADPKKLRKLLYMGKKGMKAIADALEKFPPP